MDLGMFCVAKCGRLNYVWCSHGQYDKRRKTDCALASELLKVGLIPWCLLMSVLFIEGITLCAVQSWRHWRSYCYNWRAKLDDWAWHAHMFWSFGLESGQYPSNSIIDGTSFADESVIWVDRHWAEHWSRDLAHHRLPIDDSFMIPSKRQIVFGCSNDLCPANWVLPMRREKKRTRWHRLFWWA